MRLTPTIGVRETVAPLRIGLDYRAVTAAPLSGVARQTLAMHAAMQLRGATEVLPCTAAPLGHPHRALAQCPKAPSPVDGLHRLPERLKFEWGFLPGLIERQHLDIYIATINMGLPIGLGPRPAGATRLVLQLHDVFQITLRNRHASRLREWLYRASDRLSIAYSVRVADAIWVPSKHTAQCLIDIFPQAQARVRVLPNAVPSEPWQGADDAQVPGLPSRYWLLVGAREPRKNVPWFIAAWAQARAQGQPLPELVLVGQPQDLPVCPQGVTVLQGLSDPQLRTVYTRAERLWHPSYAEGFGLPVVEALACGTPVAVAQGSSLDEVCPPWAPRFDTRDAAALTALMHRLAMTPRLPEEPDSACRAWARRFDLPDYTARLHALLEELA